MLMCFGCAQTSLWIEGVVYAFSVFCLMIERKPKINFKTTESVVLVYVCEKDTYVFVLHFFDN